MQWKEPNKEGDNTRNIILYNFRWGGCIWAAGQSPKSPDNPPQPLLQPNHPWKGDWSRKGQAIVVIFERVTSSWPVTEAAPYCTSTWPPFCHPRGAQWEQRQYTLCPDLQYGLLRCISSTWRNTATPHIATILKQPQCTQYARTCKVWWTH